MQIKFRDSYFKMGLTLVIVIAISILFFFAIFRYSGLLRMVNLITTILTPFIYGLVIAYLLCPLYNWGVRQFSKIKFPKIRGKDIHISVAKGLSTVFCLLIMFIVVGALLWAIIPQLVESVATIAKQLPTTITNFITWMQNRFQNVPAIAKPMENLTNSMSDKFVVWVEKKVIPEYAAIVSGISGGLFGAVKMVLNFFIGTIIFVFFINQKEIFAAQSKKLIFAVGKEKWADGFLKGAAFTNYTFGKFINGKILDSIIVGIICFIVMAIFQWPYALLISVIIGVTNIIPFFGPFIGAIPSTILLLMEDPLVALYFLIFVLILQQVDGNIIGPKILGDSTGLSSFWVIFAILLGGGLFGFVGMIVGIPIFAVIYAYVCYGVNKRLEKKGLSKNLKDYKELYKYDKGIKIND